LGKFIPNLAAKTQDLRALVKKNAEFVWEETHTKILEALKAELLRKEGASVPVETPDTKVTASPPKQRPETSIKQKPDNPPDSVRTS
ncbi:unnamed protein product, partial [Porites lobata]